MISEYSEKKECQRLRSLYEMKEAPILMITERALVFQKIRVRFARNMILYAMPESPDIIEHSFKEIMQLSSNFWCLKTTSRQNLKCEKETSQFALYIRRFFNPIDHISVFSWARMMQHISFESPNFSNDLHGSFLRAGAAAVRVSRVPRHPL